MVQSLVMSCKLSVIELQDAMKKEDQVIDGYEELCIRNNRYLQQRLYEQLMMDFSNLYRGYECSMIQER